MLFTGMLMLFALDNHTSGKMVDYFARTAGRAEQIDISASALPLFIRDNVTDLLLILAPYLLATTLAVLLANFVQVGLTFSAQPLNPDLGRLNPVRGFQRIFSMNGIVELVKNLLKLILVGSVAIAIIYRFWPGILSSILMPPLLAVDYSQMVAFKIAMFCTALLLVLAILDYMYQRFEFEKSIRMSKQEIKDEYKNMEGDPLVKRRIREMGRRLAMSRMFERLQRADAVITNPTHYAVALVYELDWPAPQVVAKGRDYMARRIIRYAEELGIPVYQQPELARALYKVELDQYVPGGLFKAVARVLAHISRHDAKLRRKLSRIRPSQAAAGAGGR